MSSNSLLKKAKADIEKLIEKYRNVVRSGEESEYNEEEVKIKFINPLLEALGWDVRGPDVKPEKRTLRGITDFSLKTEPKGPPRIFYEIKPFREDLDGYRMVAGKKQSYAMQAINAAFSARVDWCVLTNFKEFRLYHSNVRKPSEGLVFGLKFEDYVTETGFAKLWNLSKDRVGAGILDELRRRRTREDVSTEVVNDLYRARKYLTGIINKNNELSKEELRESVQKILDRLVVIRVAEDRGIIHAESLSTMVETWKKTAIDKSVRTLMRDLKNLFRDFDSVYNSKLFEKHICEDLRIDNEVLEAVIRILYGYNFDLIDADVLGSIYEDYIGHILEEKEKDLDIVEDYATRKKSGIYYTPTYIVDFIVKETLGNKLRKNCNMDEIGKIRLLDPACGSGSFLIKAFDYFEKAHEAHKDNLSNDVNKNRPIHEYMEETPNVRRRILSDNLWGVDLDEQAAEIASVNLLLKALKREERLPLLLGENIRVGNSLISGDESELKNYFHDSSRIKPFNWFEEFGEILHNGGFHIVVGNPPWVKDLSDEERNWLVKHYSLWAREPNTAQLFVERCLSLLADDGLLGFILPSMIRLKENYVPLRKYITENFHILKIIDVGYVFRDVEMPAFILIVQKRTRSDPQVELSYTTPDEFEEGTHSIWKVDQSWLRTVNEYKWVLAPKELLERFIERKNCVRLSQLIDNKKSKRGVEIGKSGAVMYCNECRRWFPASTEKKRCIYCKKALGKLEVKEDKIILDKPIKGKTREILTGDEIRRYKISGYKFIKMGYSGINYKGKETYTPGRILIRETGERLAAAVEDEGLMTLRTLYNLHLKENCPYDPKFIVAILNSDLIQFYFDSMIKTERKTFPKIRISEVRDIPIPKLNLDRDDEYKQYTKILDAAKDLMVLYKENSWLLSSFKRLCRNLGLTKEEKLSYYFNVKDPKKAKEFGIDIAKSERMLQDEKGTIRTLSVCLDNKSLIIRISTLEEERPKDALKLEFRDDHLRDFFFLTLLSKSGPKGYTTPKVLFQTILEDLSIPRLISSNLIAENANSMKTVIELLRDEFTQKSETIFSSSPVKAFDLSKMQDAVSDREKAINKGVYLLYGVTEESSKAIGRLITPVNWEDSIIN